MLLHRWKSLIFLDELRPNVYQNIHRAHAAQTWHSYFKGWITCSPLLTINCKTVALQLELLLSLAIDYPNPNPDILERNNCSRFPNKIFSNQERIDLTAGIAIMLIRVCENTENAFAHRRNAHKQQNKT